MDPVSTRWDRLYRRSQFTRTVSVIVLVRVVSFHSDLQLDTHRHHASPLLFSSLYRVDRSAFSHRAMTIRGIHLPVLAAPRVLRGSEPFHPRTVPCVDSTGHRGHVSTRPGRLYRRSRFPLTVSAGVLGRVVSFHPHPPLEPSLRIPHDHGREHPRVFDRHLSPPTHSSPHDHPLAPTMDSRIMGHSFGTLCEVDLSHDDRFRPRDMVPPWHVSPTASRNIDGPRNSPLIPFDLSGLAVRQRDGRNGRRSLFQDRTAQFSGSSPSRCLRCLRELSGSFHHFSMTPPKRSHESWGRPWEVPRENPSIPPSPNRMSACSWSLRMDWSRIHTVFHVGGWSLAQYSMEGYGVSVQYPQRRGMECCTVSRMEY